MTNKDFAQIAGSGENGDKPVFVNKEWAKEMGIPIIEAVAHEQHPLGDVCSPQGLDFSAADWGKLISVKALYPHWCLWAGDADALENWIKANEKNLLFRMIKSSDSRSLWAFMRLEDARHFCAKFKGGYVNANDAVFT